MTQLRRCGRYGDSSTERVPTECVFFFQAEDGIRDLTVTGVQTCALPISFHLSGNPPRKGSNRRAMSEVPESSVGAGRREAKGGRNSPWPTGRPDQPADR